MTSIQYGALFGSELVGTLMLILFGNGIVYNVISPNTKGSKGGIIAIAFGWGIAVLVGVLTASAIAYGKDLPAVGAINPAVSAFNVISLVNVMDAEHLVGMFFVSVVAQIMGAIFGQTILNLVYWRHAKELGTSSLGAHSTSPTHPGKENIGINVFSEFVGTFSLVFIAAIAIPLLLKTATSIDGSTSTGSFSVIAVGLTNVIGMFLIVGIGLSLGGTTGYAINPARDLGPRITFLVFHKLWKFEGSMFENGQWSYSWIPTAIPLLTGFIVGGLSHAWPILVGK